MLRFNGEEPCTPSRSGDKTCYIFTWIGQGFDTCEVCARPYWYHLYNPAYGGSKGTFRVKTYISYNDSWEWRRVDPIEPDDREAIKQKWSGYTKRHLNVVRRTS